jgi:chemotaxis protein methyltransferase CheR
MTAVSRSGNAGERPVVGGEFAFTDADFRQIAAILYADSGIHLPDTKATLVYSRLAKRLRAIGLRSFREYCALVSGADGVPERQAMLTALTTNVTRFFREPHHFEHLKAQVLPGLVEAARGGGRVRLWSAGCSTGQEPFSMALTLLSLFPAAADHDVRILATDIDPNVLAEAEAAEYGTEAVSAIPEALRGRWLETVKGAEGLRWRMGAAVRGLVAFRELNLIGQWPMRGRFDVIFCRNVAIYFDDPTQERLWGRFAAALVDGGRLYVGHSERVQTPLCTPDGLTTYRRAGSAHV